MINFALGRFIMGRNLLQTLLNQTMGNAHASPHGQVPIAAAAAFETNAKLVITYCIEEPKINDVFDVGVDIDNLVSNYKFQPYTWNRLNVLLQRLWDDLEKAISKEFFFHYSYDGAILVSGAEKLWAPVIKSFPSSKDEIIAALDCYAIGYHTACVFHMMRVAELGLRTIAKERGVKSVGKNKPIEWGTWKDVFEAIEKQLKDIRGKPAGPKRDAALAFYDTAISDLRTLQGLYRDPTMHFRDKYDRGESYSAIFRVSSLMKMLATKLDEMRPRKIRWGF